MNRIERMSSGAVLALASVALLSVATVAVAAESRVEVEAGAEAVDEAALTEVVRDAEADGLVLSVSVFADEPSGGAEGVADSLVDQHGGAALVITPEEVGGVSDDHGSAQVDVAVDQALDELIESDDAVAASSTFADRLSGGATGDNQTTSAGGLFSGGSGLPIPLPFLVIGGLVLLLSVFGRGRRRRRRRGYVGNGYGPGSRHPRRHRNARAGVGASRSSSRGSGSRSRGSSSRSRSSGRSRSRSSRSRGRSSRRR